MSGGLYRQDEIDFLKENYPIYGAKYCAKKLGRTSDTIMTKAKRLNLRFEKRFYTSFEIDFLIKNYPIYGSKYCSEHLGRSIKAVSTKAIELNLHVVNYFYSQNDINFLKENFSIKGAEYCSKYLNRTKESVFVKASELDLHINNYYYSEDDIKFLKENYSINGSIYCTKYLNKTKSSILSKSSKLKLPINRNLNIENGTKICNKCKLEQPLSEFSSVISKGKDKYNHNCKLCVNNHNKKPEIKNKNNKKIKERRKTDPLFKLSHNIQSNIRMGIKNGGYNKKSRTHEILGCSYDFLLKYIEDKFSLENNLDNNGNVWMNWENQGNPKDKFFELNKTWDIDHIIPLSSATNEEELLNLCKYTNLQPLCSYTNRWIKRNVISFTC